MIAEFIAEMENFDLNRESNLLLDPDESKRKTVVRKIKIRDIQINQYVNEFWTSKQRQANSIHEVSYRACFKPQLPRFFIRHLTREGDYVYDPFLGRGTTLIEAALLDRQVIGNDTNPLSRILSEARLLIPDLIELEEYLDGIRIDYSSEADIDLSMFYHPETESEIVSLRKHVLEKEENNELNELDKWIRMVATNRLTGHSRGFFSVYTMPPNQAVGPERQIKINEKRDQKPEYRDVKELILRKTRSLMKDITDVEKERLRTIHRTAVFSNKDARKSTEIPDEFVQLTVTSPPFLDVVQYAQDNWLRCWFNGIDAREIEKLITMSRTIEQWTDVMQDVFNELYRITKNGGYVAFEVGEVRNGKIRLDEHIVPLGMKSGFEASGILINEQEFTKTANIWGVSNNNKGTNSNRIVIFEKN
jgi:DNA modification methylase